MRGREERQRIILATAARETGTSDVLVRCCVRLELVSDDLTAEELSDLRRIRQLIEPGVNLTGIEIILRMRERIIELEAEVERVQGAATRMRSKGVEDVSQCAF